MKRRDIVVIEKRNIITDLKFKDFLLVNICKSSSEDDALRNLLRWNDDFLHQVRERKLPQIQIRFPFKWQKLGSRLKQLGYYQGLYVIEKKLTRAYTLPKNIRKIHRAVQIKEQLLEQQFLHFQFNPLFFDDPKIFRYEEYLHDLRKRIENNEGVLYGLYHGKTIIGFIGLENDNSGVYINELFVEKKYRGTGFGKILMQAGFYYAVKAPHRKIWTTLASQNDRGLHFYKTCGFYELAQVYFMNLSAPPAPLSGGALDSDLVRQRALPPFNARWRCLSKNCSNFGSGSSNFVQKFHWRLASSSSKIRSSRVV